MPVHIKGALNKNKQWIQLVQLCVMLHCPSSWQRVGLEFEECCPIPVSWWRQVVWAVAPGHLLGSWCYSFSWAFISAYSLLKLERLSEMLKFLSLYLSGKGCHLKMFTITVARTIGRIMWCPLHFVLTEKKIFTNLPTATRIHTPVFSITLKACRRETWIISFGSSWARAW